MNGRKKVAWIGPAGVEICVELEKQVGGRPILPLNHCSHRRLLRRVSLSRRLKQSEDIRESSTGQAEHLYPPASAAALTFAQDSAAFTRFEIAGCE
jgi:hypothetical protein